MRLPLSVRKVLRIHHRSFVSYHCHLDSVINSRFFPAKNVRVFAGHLLPQQYLNLAPVATHRLTRQRDLLRRQ